MRRIRLNLAALRARRLPRTLRQGLSAADLLDSQESLTLTRRALLGWAGAAAATFPLRAAGSDARPFQFVAGRKRVAFRFDGEEKWVIDARRFAGTPKLRVLRREGLIRVELRNARYPGTEIPADTICELKRAVVGWQMHIKLALGGFEAKAPFERWLAGEVPARSPVRLESVLCRLGSSASLSASGRAQVDFFPDWTLRLSGHGVARLLGVSGGAASDSLGISLLAPEDASLLSQPQRKRTLLAMNRGDRSWPLRPDLGEGRPWDLVVSDSSFDQIHIEAGESLYGEFVHALAAESRTDKPEVSIRPGEHFTGSDGSAFRLPLRNARYAMTFDAGREESAFVADYGPTTEWIHTKGCSFEVGGEGAQPFEVVCSQGAVKHVRCAPALRRISAPLPGVVTSVGTLREGTRLAFALGPAGPGKEKKVQTGEVQISTSLAEILQGPLLSVDVVRPDDLLVLKFDFFNLHLVAGLGSPRLVRTLSGKPAYIVAYFRPQHIAEQSFVETEQPQPLGKEAEPPIQARLSGWSRLAFIVPDEMEEVAYSLDTLLDWTKFEQSVTFLATPPAKIASVASTVSGSTKVVAEPKTAMVQGSNEYYQTVQPVTQTSSAAQLSKKKKKKETEQVAALQPSLSGQLAQLLKIKEPELFQTAIEAPFRLILSPNYYAGWAHALKPVEHKGRTELWHTRLGVRSKDGKVDEQSAHYRTVRAVWARDYQSGCLSDVDERSPFLTSPTTKDRYEIVRLSSDLSITKADGKSYTPLPIQVNRLMLSTLGAWLNVHGAWDPPEDVPDSGCASGKFSFAVEDWRQIAVMGRDQYVRVVRRGYLFPFGHRAVKLTLTERKFNRTPVGHHMAAYLRQKTFILVREFEKTYPATGQQHTQGPKLPFQTVRILTASTPALDARVALLKKDKQKQASQPSYEPVAFYPQVSGSDFQFQMSGTDWEGRNAEFTAPLIFVEADPARNLLVTNELVTLYATDADESRRKRPFSGQQVAYAKNKQPGDTTFETNSITFLGEPPAENASVPTGQAYFYPGMKASEVRVGTVEQLTGSAALTNIEYHPTYLESGLESSANKGQVFAKLLESVPLQFGGSGASSDKVGGLAAPSMEINGLSRTLGPVAGDLAKMVGGKFDPADIFADALNASLLGDISLKDVIGAVEDFSSALEKVPKFVTTKTADSVVTTFTWQPVLQNVPTSDPFFVVTGNPQESMTVVAKLTQRLDNSAPSTEITGSIKKFEIRLVPGILDVLVLAFNELSFKSLNGKKPDFSADLSKIEFKGPLAFINALKDYIDLGGFNDPPCLEVTAEGIEVGYTLGLPPVAVGVFTLSNISLGAQLNVYFTGKPIRFAFDFCQEHQPFLLAVSIYGGGGYFGIALSPQGVTRMAGTLEFGGSFSLSLGVASGGVYLMAGLSYVYESGNTTLTGYLRCGGSLEVLGIITISLEFKMSLEYQSAGNKVIGRATLTVEVKVLFFSKSVSLTLERQFAGSGGENAALPGSSVPYPLGSTPVAFADQMEASDWQAYCEAFA